MAALFAVSVASAQRHDGERHDEGRADRHHKDFSHILPQQGDLATGIDLAGAVKFIGNSFADSKPEGRAITPFGGNAFFAKYFLTDNIALRARLGVNVGNYTERAFSIDDVAYAVDPTTDRKVTDTEKYRYGGFDLGVGIEFRRSLRRVQGWVGAEAFIGTVGERYAFEYGNAITSTNPHPSTSLGGFYGKGRLLEEKSRSIRGGLSVLTGVDYFLSRNVSLGLEFGLTGYGTLTKPQGYDYERWDTVGNKLEKDHEERFPKQTKFDIVPTAGVNLMFYF